MTTPEDRKAVRNSLEKAVVKEAIEEWLDKQFAAFGKWSFFGIASALMAWLFFGWLSAQGFHK